MKWSIVLLLLPATAGFGQSSEDTDRARSAAYLELVGNAIGISANYEYRAYDDFWLRVGAGLHNCFCEADYVESDAAGDEVPASTTLVILTANYLTPKFSHHVDVGAGILYILGDPRTFPNTRGRDERIIATASLGYRYQPFSKGFVFRLGITPVFASQRTMISVGLSLGVAL